MKDFHRNVEKTIIDDLQKKFVFLSGPRQVGKTTLAKRILKGKKGKYYLYDDADDRRIILEKKYTSQKWVCLDEFHKFARWKNHIKGVFDKHHETLHLLLTGSARLDVFQKSGDSLFGRYYPYHLHPFSLGELHSSSRPTVPEDFLIAHEPLKHTSELLRFGGFPEPFSLQSVKEHRRWSNTRRQLLIQQDLREISQIELISLVEQLMLLLPHRIGSLFSQRSLAENIQVSAPTIQNWMRVFEQLFLVFKIKPYSRNIVRSLHKQAKYFLYDWSQIEDAGARFENFVASHLLKAVQVWNDLGEGNFGLHFLRDRNGREVDFLLTNDNKPFLLLETKLAETQFSESLHYFSKHLNVPAVQLLQKNNVVKMDGNCMVISANRWLGHLP
ncbi:MAG: hypothetical protein COX62_04430 [Deltaproteobacteria bacterium CG_4_10_14_0_2_um_filter_43_8]|nr:MAG: hypothetical protein COV43_05180 [Deltaproteobacteria bacterium CG11_big_fil_rev_8_21_14_0_20_42_23]PJA20585.1 MAG: hypothetical protein COX62_04430 [Deltaproteobacteria bacterium CG_4_10_14_0_2_um_filter_43_8]PJC63623.1 MAG: hypothetical protein CO021_08660 [Deltaproteobacteria bacterium CG_4_9_14_0_2_um_filter_42_21]